MTIFDWFIVAVILLSTIMAAAQGLLLEVISLVALVLGLWLAFWNYGVLAAPLAHVIRSIELADVLAFLLIALGVMLVIGLIGRAASKAARTVGLGGLDSLLGAIFGIIRGCFLVVIAIIAIAAFMPQKTWLKGSKLAPYFLSAANQVSAGAPAELRGRIREGVVIIEQSRHGWIRLHLHPHPATR
ncbi:MAG: CvpA family protein [Terriglobia bacterium]|nr:CvpA family protein [Terriglobia bacterium]